MRTTLTINDDRMLRPPFRDVVNAALRGAVEAPRQKPCGRVTRTYASKPRPGFDPAGFNKLVDELDDDVRAQAGGAMSHCDINLLVYATVSTLPQHKVALAWLEERLKDDSLSLPVIFGFVRVVTNRRIFENPRSVDDALADVQRWLDAGAQVVTPGPRHFDVAFRLLRELGTAGNRTTDLQLAALAVESQAELHSADADFGRVRGLRWVNPLH